MFSLMLGNDDSSKQAVKRLAMWSIMVAFAIMGLKFVAWWMTGSVALYSDALESIVNVIAAAAALWAITLSHKPADSDHQFGHHKAEYVSAVLEGVLIVVAALLIIAEAWRAWHNPQPMTQAWGGLAINGLAAGLNLFWAQLLIRVGSRAKSPALEADGQHIMTDVVTSVGVIAGLVAAVLTGWHWLDPLLALLVALNILWQGSKVIAASLDGLMDKAASEEEIAHIRNVIAANLQGALEIHDLRTRVAARAIFVEFHMVVNAAMSVGDSHAICDRIEDALKAEIPSVRVVIHVEPDDEAKLTSGRLTLA